MSLLTLYVAAFDRPAELERLLASIPLHPDVDVVVSDDSGTGALGEVAGVTHDPRRYNIGRDANLLRAVAVCDSPWLWVMGDDDWLLPGALEIIVEECRRGRADRIILHPEGAPMPVTGHSLASVMIERLRPEPSLLIAATLCSANVFRTSTLRLSEGMRHFDSYYAYAWAGIHQRWWTILDTPTIGVGVEHANTVPDVQDRWADYLQGLCAAARVAPIPVEDALGWNFVSVTQQAASRLAE